MKKLSYWAKANPRKARIIIVASFLTLNALGIITGVLLRDLGIHLPLVFMLLFMADYAAAFLLYPYGKSKRNYRFQKTCDLVLAGSTFFMIVFLGNHPRQIFNNRLFFGDVKAGSLVLQPDSSVKKYKSISAYYASMYGKDGKPLPWKERKKLMKEQVKALRHAGDLSNGAKIVLIILAVLVALALISLVTVLACTLSCNGSDAAAIALGIGGWALIIILTTIAIRAIRGKKRKKPETPGEKDTTQ